jgi:hypothetical protein
VLLPLLLASSLKTAALAPASKEGAPFLDGQAAKRAVQSHLVLTRVVFHATPLGHRHAALWLCAACGDATIAPR